MDVYYISKNGEILEKTLSLSSKKTLDIFNELYYSCCKEDDNKVDLESSSLNSSFIFKTTDLGYMIEKEN